MGEDRLLVVNADDFGITPEVSSGILECPAAGLVRSTTVMANIASDDDFSLFMESGLASGLHFNITHGAPLALWQPDLLSERGGFDRDRAGGYPADLIEEELHGQWGFLTSRGIDPTHLDSHHHVHALPAVLPVFVKFALLDAGFRFDLQHRPSGHTLSGGGDSAATGTFVTRGSESEATLTLSWV